MIEFEPSKSHTICVSLKHDIEEHPPLFMNDVSLSTIVLNSKDWSEIVWLPKILRFKNQPRNRLYLKKPAGMHWLGYNDAVSWLNEAKTRIFQPTANFEIFEIYLYFICLLACQPTCLL